MITLFKNLEKELHTFIPDYNYIYHDLGEIPDEAIEALENKFLQASLLTLKYSLLKAELVKWLPTILSLAMGAQKNLQSALFVYTFEVSELKEPQIRDLMEELPTNIKNTVMSTADIFIEKGKKLGLEEGRREGDRQKTEKAVRNMILEGLPVALICKIQEVTPDYVARIREESGER